MNMPCQSCLGVKTDIAAYIVGFYNTERLHSVLGNLLTSVFERNMAIKKSINVS
jgi:putative transposase